MGPAPSPPPDWSGKPPKVPQLPPRGDAMPKAPVSAPPEAPAGGEGGGQQDAEAPGEALSPFEAKKAELEADPGFAKFIKLYKMKVPM